MTTICYLLGLFLGNVPHSHSPWDSEQRSLQLSTGPNPEAASGWYTPLWPDREPVQDVQTLPVMIPLLIYLQAGGENKERFGVAIWYRLFYSTQILRGTYWLSTKMVNIRIFLKVPSMTTFVPFFWKCMSGEDRIVRGVRDRQRTLSWDSNSGSRKCVCTMCRSTAHYTHWYTYQLWHW